MNGRTDESGESDGSRTDGCELPEKLVDIDAKIAALQVMRADLVDVLNAGCTDLRECSCEPACPVPFTDLDTEPRST